MDPIKFGPEGFVNALEDLADETSRIFKIPCSLDVKGDTDDASLIERYGFKVTVVEPTGLNFKVTTKQDLDLVQALLTESEDA